MLGSLPIPPVELRRLVGPFHVEAWDNPGGGLVYPEVPASAYEAVFDFGCGCGRVARQLLQQRPRPRRYVGIDVNRRMVEWCIQNLQPIAPDFRFFHHDVYSPTYARDNRYQAAAPFPTEDGGFSLLIANSVFTHLVGQQAEYYLHEVSRILRPGGLAFTSWFFFDRESFPFLREPPYCLYASDADPTRAVLYDRRWFLDMVHRCGLRVRLTSFPTVPGHQWYVLLERQDREPTDRFPLGDQGAEWLSGATQRRIAMPTITPAERGVWNIPEEASPIPEPVITDRWPEPPTLSGPVAEVAAMKGSWTWRIGTAVTEPLRMVRDLLFRNRPAAGPVQQP
jgi:SAM-dependent methyltransferase